MTNHTTWICASCGLYDPYDGDGDGIGSCECARCEWCDGPPLVCDCALDDSDYTGDSEE